MPIDAEAREVTVCNAIIDEINDNIATSSGVVTNATNAAPIQITTATPHGFFSGAAVTIAAVGGNTAANGDWTVKVVDTTNFTLNDSTGNAPYTTGGTWTGMRFTAAQAFSTDYKLANLQMLRCDVQIVPQTDTEALDRWPSSEDRYRFEIAIQKAAFFYDLDNVNTLIALAKRVSKRFYPNYQLTAFTNPVVCVENETELFNAICLKDYGHFHCRIALTFREYVDD